VQEATGVDGMSLGAISVEVDQDWMMRSIDIGTPRSVVLGDATLAPKSLGTLGQGVSGLLLSGSPSFLPLPINWR
jgi:hypothetical protein